MISSAPLVVFDLDGTLADTAHDLVATLNAILGQEGVQALPLEKASDLIGAGGRVLLQRGFAAAGVDLAPSRLEDLYGRFLVHYADNICVETRLFPGVEAALDRLEEDGFGLAICTNKIEAHSVALLRALGVGHRFAAICGRDTFAYFKPDPRHLTLTIERCGGDPRRAVMVGDSRSDIAAAKAARIPVVAVTFGYTEVPVQELRPDAVIDEFDDLFDAVQGLLVAEAA